MSKSLLASLIALGGLAFAIPSVTAAPTSPIPAAPSATLEIEQINHRCNGPRLRNGYCPNPAPHYGYRYAPRYRYYEPRYRYGYYGSPGITLRFGSVPRYRYYGGW